MNSLFTLFLDLLTDSLKTLPFLFLAYLIIEYIEHKATARFTDSLLKFHRIAPTIGAFTGLVPLCGISISVIRLFTGGLVSAGTLLAVLIATSDEAIPVLLSNPQYLAQTAVLLCIKLLLAVAAGNIYDIAQRKKSKPDAAKLHDGIHEHCEEHCCENGPFITAIKHTLMSWIFIFLSITVFGVTVYFVGEEVLASVLMSGSVFQPLFSALIGLVPGCAPSIMFSTLYMSNALSFGSLVSGLITNTGIGAVFLFRTNRNIRQNLFFTFLLIIMGSTVGLLLQLLKVFA